MMIGLAVALLLLPAGEDEREEPEGTSADTSVDTSVVLGHREHQDALKACTAPALQRQQAPRSTRIQVTLSVDEAGAVNAVAVSAPKELAGVTACLEGRLKHWTFPARAQAYSVTVPVILQGSAR